MKRRTFLVSAAAAATMSIPAFGASASPSGDVTFYSATSNDILALIKAFNAVYPNIKVNLITGEGGALLARLRSERGRPQADVINISADALLNFPELFKPYTSKEHDSFEPWGVIRNGDKIYGYGFTISIQIFAYNTSKMTKEDAPTSWQDMISPKFKGKYLVANPTISTAGYGSLSQVVQTYGWEGADRYAETGRFSTNTNLIPQSLARGEEALVIAEETKLSGLITSGYPVATIYPSEGLSPTVEGIGLIANGPHPENAMLLAEFINSKQGHDINASARNRRTPRIDSAQPVGLPKTSDLKINPKFDFLEGVRSHDEWVKKFAAILQSRQP